MYFSVHSTHVTLHAALMCSLHQFNGSRFKLLFPIVCCCLSRHYSNMPTCLSRVPHFGVFAFCCGRCCLTDALVVGARNGEENRSNQSCMDKCLGEGGKWDDMCENIRERTLNMPDHESEVGINALRHCEQGRRHHNQDCEFKCWHQSFREL